MAKLEIAKLVVVAEVLVEFTIVRLVIVEVELLTRMPPVIVANPEPAMVVKEAAPAVRASAPMSMEPKPLVIEPPLRIPTEVSDEETTAEPSAVAERVLTPLMLRARPEAKLRLPLTY